MEKRADKFAIAIRVDADMKKAIEKAAKADQRTVTSLTKKALADYLRRNGFLPAVTAEPVPADDGDE
jgi:predicted transcriptional regulator